MGAEQSRGLQGEFWLFWRVHRLEQAWQWHSSWRSSPGAWTLQNMPEESLFPLCYSSCRCRASLLLGFRHRVRIQGPAPFCLPYLLQISVNLSRWNLMVARSTSSSEYRRTLPEGPVELFPPLHRYGRPRRRTKSLMPYPCKPLRIPVEFTPSVTSSPAPERGIS